MAVAPGFYVEGRKEVYTAPQNCVEPQRAQPETPARQGQTRGRPNYPAGARCYSKEVYMQLQSTVKRQDQHYEQHSILSECQISRHASLWVRVLPVLEAIIASHFRFFIPFF